VNTSPDNEHGKLFTIGHSNHSLDDLIKLLTDNNIQVLVDVRSHPYSKFARQFDSPLLKKAAIGKGIKYMYFGRELGGRPNDPTFYDQEGYVLYNLVAQTPAFLKNIKRLVSGVEKKHRIALMCSEEDPKYCHRRLLIGRALARYGIAELHIRGNGQIQTEYELSGLGSGMNGHQLSMFAELKEDDWRSAKSIRSASQNEEQRNSSKP
jgi:uncharacterized protein (DUF488 family)